MSDDRQPNQPRESDRIQCLECGRWFRALPTHLIRTHEMSDEDYRLKYGIPVGLPLVCVEWSENQSRKAIANDTKKTLTPGIGPKPGYTQRESVRQTRKSHYSALALKGMEASHAIDKTAKRRELLKPYPVTVAQATERLACQPKAAYSFLSWCVLNGKLKRIARGHYGEISNELG